MNRFYGIACLLALAVLGTGWDGDASTGFSHAGICPDSPAPELFDATLCVCEDLLEIGNLVVGSSVEGNQPVVGVNGSTHFINNTDIIGAEQVRLTAGSTLDLLVSGAVRNIGHIDLGDRYAPSAFRLYIGGTEPGTVSVGNALFNGAIYAPEAELHYVGNTRSGALSSPGSWVASAT